MALQRYAIHGGWVQRNGTLAEETMTIESAPPSHIGHLRAVGRIRSTLEVVGEAPLQGQEGAPDAWIEVDPTFADALHGLTVGDDLVVITWLHRADRDVLQVHPRSDPRNPLTGVFGTRSPHRPNPLGLHSVKLLALDGTRLCVGPIEAIDETPVVDIKIAHS